MPDQGKKRGLTPEQWTEVKTAYEGGEPIASLSRRFSIRRNTISDRAKREGWTVQPTVQLDGSGKSKAQTVQERAESKVIDMTAHAGFKRAQETGAVDAIAQAVTQDAQTYADLADLRRDAVSYMKQVVADAKADKITPASSPGEQTKADVAKAVMAAVKTLSSTLREDLGRVRGQPTIPTDDKKDKVEKIKFTIVREPTGTEG